MFKVVTPLSSHWHHFWWEICCHFYLYSLVCNASFALAAFNIFYLSLDSSDMLLFSSCFLCFGILVVLGFVVVIFMFWKIFFPVIFAIIPLCREETSITCVLSHLELSTTRWCSLIFYSFLNFYLSFWINSTGV